MGFTTFVTVLYGFSVQYVDEDERKNLENERYFRQQFDAYTGYDYPYIAFDILVDEIDTESGEFESNRYNLMNQQDIIDSEQFLETVLEKYPSLQVGKLELAFLVSCF